MTRLSASPEPRSRVSAPAGDRTTAGLLITSLRPEQWTKNLFVFAGMLFGGRLLQADALWRAAAAFAIFCSVSGAVYLFNDLADREADQRHPLKRMRPIASGHLSARTALVAGMVLSVAGISAATLLQPMLGLVTGAYVGLLLLYSAALKHRVIVDVLTIAAGFVLRAMAGAIGHRRILEEYSPYLLDQMIAVVTASTLIAYTLYTVSPDTEERFGTNRLGLTIPFVLYGIFRYLYLVHQKRGGGSPAAMLLTDVPLLACVALWTLSVALILYV